MFLSPHIRATMFARMDGHDIVFSQETDQRVINSGFYMMRSTFASKRFMSLVIQGQGQNEVVIQQRVMSRVLRPAFTRDFMECPYHFLDICSYFLTGYDYFRKNLPNKFGIQPLMLHANCLIGDKKDALAKEGMWYL